MNFDASLKCCHGVLMSCFENAVTQLYIMSHNSAVMLIYSVSGPEKCKHKPEIKNLAKSVTQQYRKSEGFFFFFKKVLKKI